MRRSAMMRLLPPLPPSTSFGSAPYMLACIGQGIWLNERATLGGLEKLSQCVSGGVGVYMGG